MNTHGGAGDRPDTRRDGGFSLVELLIVIVVLGILSTVTVFAVRGISDRGEQSGCGIDARSLQTAAEVYMAQESVDTLPATGTDGDRFERTLVAAELLDEPSTKYDMGADGSVSTTGTPCV